MDSTVTTVAAEVDDHHQTRLRRFRLPLTIIVIIRFGQGHDRYGHRVTKTTAMLEQIINPFLLGWQLSLNILEVTTVPWFVTQTHALAMIDVGSSSFFNKNICDQISMGVVVAKVDVQVKMLSKKGHLLPLAQENHGNQATLSTHSTCTWTSQAKQHKKAHEIQFHLDRPLEDGAVMMLRLGKCSIECVQLKSIN